MERCRAGCRPVSGGYCWSATGRLAVTSTSLTPLTHCRATRTSFGQFWRRTAGTRRTTWSTRCSTAPDDGRHPTAAAGDDDGVARSRGTAVRTGGGPSLDRRHEGRPERRLPVNAGRRTSTRAFATHQHIFICVGRSSTSATSAVKSWNSTTPTPTPTSSRGSSRKDVSVSGESARMSVSWNAGLNGEALSILSSINTTK